MLLLVARRARSQALLLAAVLLVVVLGATLLGTCALLLTTSQRAALQAALLQADPQDVQARTSFAVAEGEPEAAARQAGEVLVAALSPFPARTSTSWTSPLLVVAGSSPTSLGYLAGFEDPADHAELADGRWPAPARDGGPAAPREVAVPVVAADRLGLEAGSRLALGAPDEAGRVAGEPVEVVVVGTYEPAPDDAVWDRDRLRGQGFSPEEDVPATREAERLPTHGPFLVAGEQLPALAEDVSTVVVTASPDLSVAAQLPPAALDGVLAALEEAPADIRVALGPSVSSVRLRASLPGTLYDARVEQQATSSQVVVLVLVGAVLALTALGLAGRLLAGRRAAETALLSARGAGRPRLLAHAATEGAAVAVVAAVLAVPLSLLAHRGLARLPLVEAVGTSGDARATPALLAVVAVAAVALTTALVLPSLPRAEGRARAGSALRGTVARSGLDLLLLAVAVLAFLQLRARPAAPGAVDPVLVVAPVVCLVAGAAVALRVVTAVSRWGELRAGRSRGLVLPLAGWQLARRPHATGAAFLLVLATASAVFAAAGSATWLASQRAQADVAVGTDLAVAPAAGVPPLAVGAALSDAAGGEVAAVTSRPVALGSRVGSGPSGGRTRLLALDTARADAVLRGTPPVGGAWSATTAGLAPEPAAGVPLRADGDGAASVPVVVTGTDADEGLVGQVVPTLVLQDASGARVAATGPAAALDGRPHEVAVPLPAPGGGRGAGPEGDLVVVAVALALSAQEPDEDAAVVERVSQVSARVAFPTAGTVAEPDDDDGDGGWRATAPGAGDDVVPDAALGSDGAGAAVTTTVTVALAGLVGADNAQQLVATAFPVPPTVPVAVTTDLARDVDVGPGDTLTLRVEDVEATARVVRVVAYLPSAPRGPALLADSDALSRALLVQGELSPVADQWWVGGVRDPRAATARVAEAGVGEAAARADLADTWNRSPLRAGLRVALGLLVAAACALALAGTAMHVAAALAGRAVEVARLRALGVRRRAVLASLLTEHGAMVAVATTAGAVVGAVLALTVGPLLVASVDGAPPVPAAAPAWSAPAGPVLVALLLLGPVAVAVPTAVRLVRGAGAAHLRLDAPP